MKMLIMVGSTSRHKIEAVMAACNELGLEADVIGVRARSEVNEQPFGIVETRLGAVNRACNAASANPGAAVAIGIESGLQHLGGWCDMAVVIVRDDADGREFIATTAAVPLDERDVAAALQLGFDSTTVGSVMANRTGCDPTDPVAHVTGGAVSRATLLREAVKVALSQYLVRRRRRARGDLGQPGREAPES